jgi:NAD+ synthase (glutamine-hydrolysing)
MTKYDCSSADINPIGGMSKGDLGRMIVYVSNKHSLPVLKEISEAVPTVDFIPLQSISFKKALLLKFNLIGYL